MMTRKDFEWIADRFGPLVFSPLTIEKIADDLQETNPRFNREKFIQRAVAAWEKHHDVLDDEIPY
jgi:hypothetical protein